ncbi:ATP-binding protein, partial [Desulfobacterales bacterium HSG16]|nr:ATP-binding protein [Desulfobacterales bacterium HSG16]
RTEAEIKTDKAVLTLAHPLWLFDARFVRKFAEILTNDRSVIQVTVRDERNRILVDRQNAHAAVPGRSLQWQLERPVYFQDREVGRLIMVFTNSEVSLLTRQMLLSDILILICVLLAVLGTTWLLLTRQIIAPLRGLERTFHRISAGDYSERADIEMKEELAAIADEFNKMVDQVESRELKLRKSQQELRKYERMIASTTDPVWLIDRDYMVQAVNDACIRIHDTSRSRIIHNHVKGLMSSERFERQIRPNMDRCLSGENVRHQSWFDYPGCGRRYMDVIYYPCMEADNTISGIVVSERDITEQKHLESQLQQTQKMEAIGTLAGGIAHDFNNILGAIIGYAEMIEMFETDGKDTLQKRISHILKGAYRARDLVDQILTFSRHTDQEKKILSLGPIIRECLKFLRASIPSTIKIIEQIDAPNATVLANPTQMHQILMNLCTNASMEMEQTGGILTAGLREIWNETESTAYVELSVSDTGHGIAAEIMERIFDPFFTTKKPGCGTGMGLAVVHGIVTHHHGKIRVESPPAGGCTFRIFLPHAENQAEETHPEPRAALAPGKGTILFVDDEEQLVCFSKEILEHMGYEVQAETRSLAARDTFFKYPDRFDLVITDQTMPDMTGMELASEILKLRPNIPVILCTGFVSSLTDRAAPDPGIHTFIKKPLGVHQLSKIVREALDAPDKETDYGQCTHH